MRLQSAFRFIIYPLLILHVSCGGDGNADNTPISGKPRTNSVQEYRRLASELQLAMTNTPYLVLDLAAKKLQLKMAAATVWSYPLALTADKEAELASFAAEVTDDGAPLVRRLSSKRLYAALDQTPDSVLTIVGNAMNVDPELIQRELPEKFQLVFDDGFIMEFRTQVKGETRSALKNTFFAANTAMKRLLGDTYLVTSMDSNAALTLYRAAYEGLPLLVTR